MIDIPDNSHAEFISVSIFIDPESILKKVQHRIQGNKFDILRGNRYMLNKHYL